MLINIFLILILLGIAGAIVFYLVREKKRGVSCIGCPHAKSCAQKCAMTCGGTGKKSK